jgi:predicted ATPase/class 3 adenylate cyclase
VEIAGWLQSLGLGQYEAAFSANAIDMDVLRSLTAGDLADLGITVIGHRRRLLNAIAALLLDKPDTASAALPPGVAAEGSDAERRRLTVMFCDLVGSTPLSERLDPEDLREIMRTYQRTVAAVVTRYLGFIARYMGDGVLVYFGYPQAHEDDAERAVRAALEVIGVVGGLKISATELRVRVGIATGLVVIGNLIGEGASRQRPAVGEAPNLAARLQSLAEPNTVLIAASTRLLVGDLFAYRDLGAIVIKGLTDTVCVSQVLCPNAALSRFEALRGSTLTQLIGRDQEMHQLLAHWMLAKKGDGQAVLVRAEAGLGKSRLIAALDERLLDEPHLRLRYFCSPYHQDSALYPVVDQLARTSGFARDDGPAAKLAKLVAILDPADSPDDDVALLADLMSLPVSERYPLRSTSPRVRKERTLEALFHQLNAKAKTAPVIIEFEDTHWIDPTSRELLSMVVQRLGSLPVLVIATSRPDQPSPWTVQQEVSTLTLGRLDRHDQITLVAQLARGKPLPAEVVEQIVDRADGVPLYIEELTKNVLEGRLLREEADRYVLVSPLPPFALPASLHDSLMERLDRFASARLVAQVAAAIGREFSYTLLSAVSRLADDILQTALGQLVAAEVVFQRSTPPDAVYAFKHALVQDAAHNSLLRSVRRRWHATIAEALENYAPELMDSQPDIFAQHYAEAGLAERSSVFWGKAGRRSAARSNILEAVMQFHKGLDELDQLPDSPELKRKKLQFWTALGSVLPSIKGYSAPETGIVYDRARELWEQLGRPLEYLEVPFGQARFHTHRGELDLAQRLDEDLIRLSHQRNDAASLVLAHFSSGRTFMFSGKFAAARTHLETAMTHYDSVIDRASDDQVRLHHRVSSMAFLGIVLTCLGYPEQAMTNSAAAIIEAWEYNFAPVKVVALLLGTVVAQLLDDDLTLSTRADQLIATATEHGFDLYRAQGLVYHGWAKARNGDLNEGISSLRSGLSAYRATGSVTWTAHYTAMLAVAFEIAGEHDEAETQLDDALRLSESTGDRWFAAELNRYKGQLLSRHGNTDAAEAFYRQALDIARQQEARFWELRAAMSLARLCQRQGRPTEGLSVLTPVYASFTEGFETPELKRAKALSEDLATGVVPEASEWTRQHGAL